MEARQKLDQKLRLSCCRKVEVHIWNADLHPGTVWLQLLLLDGSFERQLGLVPVVSTPDVKRTPVEAVPEKLEFPFPQDGSGEFNELKAVFRRVSTRADKSARIAIDRFVLVP
jgi:hypothetical protein